MGEWASWLSRRGVEDRGGWVASGCGVRSRTKANEREMLNSYFEKLVVLLNKEIQ